MKSLRRIFVATVVAATAVGIAPAAQAAVNPVLASPYLYQWGNVPSATSVMSSTFEKP